jgi:hypothetical protein
MGVAGFSIPAVMNLEQDRSASALAEPTTGPQAK